MYLQGWGALLAMDIFDWKTLADMSGVLFCYKLSLGRELIDQQR
jgi:hypothetical protein